MTDPPDVENLDIDTTDPNELGLEWSDELDDEGRYHIRIRDDDEAIAEEK